MPLAYIPGTEASLSGLPEARESLDSGGFGSVPSGKYLHLFEVTVIWPLLTLTLCGEACNKFALQMLSASACQDCATASGLLKAIGKSFCFMIAILL